MKKNYTVKRKLQEQGGSLLVTLPKVWVEREELKEGDTVKIEFDSFDGVHVTSEKR